jgi:UPF0042 nucleotide-binding protein
MSEIQLILISGRSGSGKSAALNALEDAGFCCIDNLPAAFLPELIERQNSMENGKSIAVSIDVRTPSTDLKRLPDFLRSFGDKLQSCKILFLDASTDILVKRFNETRRKHPLTDKQTTLAEALLRESELLSEIAEVSDLTINTDQLSPYDLQDILRRQLGVDSTGDRQLVITSFGYKYGVPSSADYVFDVRCLPNPHWIPDLRILTGLDRDVVCYLEGQPQVAEMQKSIQEFLERWVPDIFAGSRSYLTIAIGCTGGKHRSVFLAERLREHFQTIFDNVQVRHRELS